MFYHCYSGKNRSNVVFLSRFIIVIVADDCSKLVFLSCFIIGQMAMSVLVGVSAIFLSLAKWR